MATLTVLDVLRTKGVASNFDDVLRDYKRLVWKIFQNIIKKY